MSQANVFKLAVSDETLTDEELMLQVAVDRLDAYEILVKRHQNRIYRMACHMLNSQEDAWDVSQEIFLKVYNARKSYVQNAKFTTWLYRIANNAVIDKIRQNKRLSKVVAVEDLMVEPSSKGHSPQALMALSDHQDQLAEALMKLSERQRSMVLMKYYEGFSIKEIADLFDCASGTVKATLFQSLKNLRQHLTRGGMSSEVIL